MADVDDVLFALDPARLTRVPNLEAVAMSDGWWWDSALRAIRWLAETGTPFSVEDVRQLGVPDPDHPNRWGAAFITAARKDVISPVGYESSRRRSRHGAPVRVWIGTPQTITARKAAS